MGFMGSCKLSSIVYHWDGIYPIIPHGCLEGIVHGPFTDARWGIAWKTCTRVRWARIVSFTASWTVATHGAFVVHMCHVIRFYPLQGVLLIRISATPSEMGDGLLVASKRSNYTFIMLYLYHVMDVDYMVVDEMVNISKLFDCNCMFSIGCKPMIITT
jgi:hypothetical protein